MAAASEAADRSLLEGDTASYGSTPAAPGAAPGAAPSAASAAPPALTPEQLLAELSRNAAVYKKMVFDYFMKGLSPLFAEAVGTFFLVFTVGCCVTSPTPSPWAPVSIGAVLTVLVYSTYRASGAMLNPAVTFALALLGKKSWGAVFPIWIFQFAGGYSAVAFYKIVCAPHLAVVAPVPPFHPAYALTAEGLYTGLLVFVVLNATRIPKGSKEPHPFFGLAIGFAALSGAYAVGHISGAALNPAVSVAMGMGGKDQHWALAWFAAELAGAAGAAGLFWALRHSELQATAAESTEAAAPLEGDTGAAEVVDAPGVVGWKHKCAAEAIGTFMLMTTFGLNIVSGSRATALSVSAVLMCMIYAVGDLSGGHFNPAVTFSVLCSGRTKLTKGEAAKYVLAQLVAGLLGALVYAGFHMASAVADKSIKLMPGKGYDVAQSSLAELFATCVLCYAVLAVTTVEGYCKEVGGLTVALAVTAGSYAIGSVSGGELNPALVLGLVLGNVVNPGKGGIGAVNSWISLLLCEFVAGYVASVLFKITHRVEYLPKKDDDKTNVKGAQADVEAPAAATLPRPSAS